jgi:serine/threonine-protein kinase
MPPEKLGRYQIVREVGHGAMGVVYEALDPTIDRKIALKAIRFDGIGTTADEAARRFKNEARAAGGLNHPNIVTVYDAGEDSGNLYLAMEFIEGSTLEELLRTQRALPPQNTIDIIRQVCAGLDFAHARGIVHRDIKPANVMLAPHSVVKITDFGIARAGEAMTITGQVVGTPNYMSPEQVLGKTLDGRSDLFSVGVMLYEMITSERPFEGQSITTIMYKIVHETPIPPKKLDASIHPGLSAVIEKSLAKAPEARFQTGAELVEALQNYQQASVTASTLGAATSEMPSLVDANATIDTAPPAVRTQNASSSSTAPASPPLLRLLRPRLLAKWWADPKARKRIIAVFVIGFLWLSSTYRRHKSASETSAPPASSTPAAPSTPPASDEGADQQPQSQQAPSTPAVVKRENVTGNKDAALLRVNSSPPSAEIYVDGKATGKTTPTDLELPRGQHSVSIRMAGFQPSSANFRVKGGEEIEYSPQLSVAMPNVAMPKFEMPDLSKLQDLSKANQAKVWQRWANDQFGDKPQLVLNSQPPGARIYIDGKDSGKTSPANISVAPGRYRLRFELQGFEPAELNVTVGRHKSAMENLVLKPLSAEQ